MKKSNSKFYTVPLKEIKNFPAGWAQTWGSSVGGERSSKELFDYLMLLSGTSTKKLDISYNTKLIPLTVLQDVDSAAVQSRVAGISATLLHPPCQLGKCTLCIL
jgi:hypothetical protein